MARLEIVDYLRSYAGGALELVAHKRADEAADEITRLREENARLREALKVAANFLDDAYTDTGRDEYKVAGFVARAAIWEGETR